MVMFQIVGSCLSASLDVVRDIVRNLSDMANRPSQRQMEALVEFLQRNPGIAKGLLRTQQAKHETKLKWQEFATAVNALGGVIKDGAAWSKYWAEKKCALKRLCQQQAQSIRRTGGGTDTVPQLSQLESRLVAVMGGQSFATGDSGLAVDPFPHSNSQPSLSLQPSTSSQTAAAEVIALDFELVSESEEPVQNPSQQVVETRPVEPSQVQSDDLNDGKNIVVQSDIRDMTEAIEMLARDQELIKVENLRLTVNMSSIVKDVDKKVAKCLMLGNEILSNFEGLLLNTKAVESMVSGIKKMRDIGRKQEITLAATEKQHANLMLELEIYRSRQTANKKTLQDTMDKVIAMEEELVALEQQFEKNILIMRRKQRDFDILNKRYHILKESLDNKSPEEVRFDALEQQINELRKRTEELQQQWLRLQGHVVRLTQRHQSLVTDIHLINTQIQVCDHKLLRIQLDRKKLLAEQSQVEHSLHDLRVRWELTQDGQKKAIERNETQTLDTVNRTHEFSANLKDAECELIEMEEEIETNENKIEEMNQYLDRLHREALIWQRKGILAVELKNNLKNAQSTTGDIGKMKTEIARMEIRRHHLLQMSEKLATELARCVTKRETAMDKNRSDAAVAEKQKEKGLTMKTQYHHKLRLAKADVARVTKDIEDSKANIETLEKEEERLDQESAELKILNTQLEENIVKLLKECIEADIEKQWLLQRIIRSQHLGIDLAKVVKHKSLKTRSKINALPDFIKAFALNDRLMYTLEVLDEEFPYLKDKMATIINTLDIHSPTNSPRIVEDTVEEVLQFANINLTESLIIVCAGNHRDDNSED